MWYNNYMALTSHQDIPAKPKANEPWTFRRLFPFAGAATSLTKVFTSPLDVLLGYLVFIIGLAELMGRDVSWFMWVFIILILAADVFERHTGILSDTKTIKKEDGK